MSKLDELIQELCPDGVEYKRIKDVCSDVIVPMRDRPKVFDGDIPWCRIEDKDGQYFNRSLSGLAVSDEVIKKMNLKVFPTGTVICSCSASLGTYAINTQPIITNQTFIGLVCSERLLNKYLLYYMETQTAYIKSQASTGTIPYVSRKKFEDMCVPVPPLEVQREIVRILDTFTELTAEITAEITARKKQYSYYRDSLLSFPNNQEVKNIALGEIAKFVYGYTDKAKDSGAVRFVRITDINEDGRLRPTDAKYVDLTEESKKYLLEKGDLLLARTGATYGKTLYFDADEPAVYASFLIKIILDNSIIRNRYYWHFSKSTLYWEQAERYVSKGGQQQFNTNAVCRVQVPVPSLDVQDRIIYVLDNFDAICSDLNIGLPAEIETRQKQYEFYRDALLTYAATGKLISHSTAQHSTAQHSTAQHSTAQHNEINGLITLCQYVFGVIFMELGSYIAINRGVRVIRSQLSVDTGFPVYQNSMTPLGYYEKSNCPANTTFVIAAGAAGEIGYCTDKFWAADDCFYFDCPDTLLSRYLYYVLLSQKDELSRHVRKASIPRLSRHAIETLRIPLPSMNEQQRIVSILDRFNTLCNDLSSGLPAELEARRKQYEYYRDQLLTFRNAEPQNP